MESEEEEESEEVERGGIREKRKESGKKVESKEDKSQFTTQMMSLAYEYYKIFWIR